MPGPYPREFREDVVAVARRRESGVTIKQIATDFGSARRRCRTGSAKQMSRKASVPVRPQTRPPRRGAEAAEPSPRAGERGPQEGGGISVAGEPETRWLPK
jgi:hypothetical protein